VLACTDINDPLVSSLVLRTLHPALKDCTRAGVRKALLDCAALCWGGPVEGARFGASVLAQGGLQLSLWELWID